MFRDEVRVAAINSLVIKPEVMPRAFSLASYVSASRQRQLSIRADMAINEVFEHRRHAALFDAEAAQNFLPDRARDIWARRRRCLPRIITTRSGSECWPLIRSATVAS